MDDIVGIRHRLHRDAEVGLQLPRTQRIVLETLDGLGLEISLGSASTSVTAVLRAPRPARNAVLLRADMDALAVREETGLLFAADRGAMHACGHDLHMAMLLGAARILSDRRRELEADVVLAFQPGEENWGGARSMLAEGLLDAAGVPIAAALGLHVFAAGVPRGAIAIRPGAMMAASTMFEIRFTGIGGHGSTPEATRDPIPALAAFATQAPLAFTRTFGMFDEVVLTVGSIRAGESNNVIPDSGTALGTVRSFDHRVQKHAREVLQRVAHGVALAHGVEATASLTDICLPTINDPAETEFALRVARAGGAEVVVPERPSPASEDFSFILDAVPGVFAFLGAAPAGVDPRTAPANHAANVVFDDGVLATGATFEAEWAISRSRRAANPE